MRFLKFVASKLTSSQQWPFFKHRNNGNAGEPSGNWCLVQAPPCLWGQISPWQILPLYMQTPGN